MTIQLPLTDCEAGRHEEEHVRVGPTNVGKGVFATRRFPIRAVIGEIKGSIIADASYCSDYCFDMENGCQLEPAPPFRYVNHSCDPNCEFDWLDEGPEAASLESRQVYLIALREIDLGDELTIDYNWPFEEAIPCQCQSPACRGWIVSIDEVHSITSPRPVDKE